ncbi:MAG: hypothetical protein JXB85_08090 [Anaerolineales bacterium]|nr:hypothetical protein [Anaerolineales bacterium]
MRPWCGLLLGLLCLTACLPAAGSPTAPAAVPQPTPTPFVPDPADIAGPPLPDVLYDPLTEELIRNAQYILAGPNGLEAVQLVDGVFQQGQGGDFVSIVLLAPIAFGDLNGDGNPDAAALAAENYGGSGQFVYLIVYLNQMGQPLIGMTRFIDDRPIVNALDIVDGRIVLAAVIHAAVDALCCPSFQVVETYGLGLGLVRLTSFTPLGYERAITIDAPADGDVVSDSVRVAGSITIAPFENNLEYHVYDQTGGELVSGPLLVSAPELGAPGTFDLVIDLSAIPPEVGVRLEIQDVNMSDGSLFAMDSVSLTIR